MATRGAALAFVALLFPDAMWPWVRRAAAAGAGSSVFLAGRRSAKLRGWRLPRRPGLHVDLGAHRALYKGAPSLRRWNELLVRPPCRTCWAVAAY